MSRVASNPVQIPKGVEVNLTDTSIAVKGKMGSLSLPLTAVHVSREGDELQFAASDGSKQARALSGTVRSLVSNMVQGTSEGFEKRLQLIGVGYRAQAQGQKLNLVVGYSHPVDYQLPEGITAETPSQTEVVIKGADKQKVGQVAAEIRSVRPPEPYKGKGIRIVGEYVRRKEAKKK